MCNSWCGPLCGLRCPETPTSGQIQVHKEKASFRSMRKDKTRATFEPEDTWVRVPYKIGQNMPSLEIEFDLDTNCNRCRSPILVREVQPPLIYVGGDGRLKLSKQSTYQSKPYFLPLKTLVRASVVRRLCLELTGYRQPRTRSGQAQPGLTQSSSASSDGAS
jgi:hypothetical protein